MTSACGSRCRGSRFRPAKAACCACARPMSAAARASWRTRRRSAAMAAFSSKGRADRIVKIEGRRVSLAELERAIKRLRWVSDAAVATVPPAETALGAIVVLSAEGEAALTRHGKFRFERMLRRELAQTHEPASLPRRWRFVQRDSRRRHGQAPAARAGAAAQCRAFGMSEPRTRRRAGDRGAQHDGDRRRHRDVGARRSFLFSRSFSRLSGLPGVVQTALGHHCSRGAISVSDPRRTLSAFKSNSSARSARSNASSSIWPYASRSRAPQFRISRWANALLLGHDQPSGRLMLAVSAPSFRATIIIACCRRSWRGCARRGLPCSSSTTAATRRRAMPSRRCTRRSDGVRGAALRGQPGQGRRGAGGGCAGARRRLLARAAGRCRRPARSRRRGADAGAVAGARPQR